MSGGTHELRMSSVQLADWLDAQGEDRWWMVDGDPLLTSRVSFPTTGDILAAKLRALNKPLLLLGFPGGRSSSPDDLDPYADTDNPRQERIFRVRWDDGDYSDEWLLSEDKESPEFAHPSDMPEDAG